MAKTNSVPFNWPGDENGDPMALISVTINETIPTAPYANVGIQKTITRYVKDADVEAELDITYDTADKVLQKKHDEILKELEA